jgi:hypothetical protein
MKILVVGNGNLRHRGARYYDPAVRMANGFIRGGHNVFFLSDRDLIYSLSQFTTPGIFGTKTHKQKHISKFFLDVCRNFKPEMIMLAHADLILPEALMDARRLLPGVKIAQMNVDIIFNAHNIAQIESKLDAVDATFITTAGEGLKKFSRPGKKLSFVPNITDSSIDWPKCFEHSDQAYDVFWALRATKGSAPGDRRIEYPIYLQENGVKIDYHGMNGKPLLYDARYFECISNARMGINLSQIWTKGCYQKADDKDLYLYSSDRIAHYTGSGLLVFITRDHKLEELFAEDKEAVYFDSKEELLDKINYYRTHDDERKRIARGGWEKAHTQYNERLITRYIVEVTMGQKLSHPYQWPVELY